MFERKFENGTEITDYQAVAYAEGFEEASNPRDVIRAWAYLIFKGTCWSLQGFFGRTANAFIKEGLISRDGVINWDEINSRMN